MYIQDFWILNLIDDMMVNIERKENFKQCFILLFQIITTYTIQPLQRTCWRDRLRACELDEQKKMDGCVAGRTL